MVNGVYQGIEFIYLYGVYVNQLRLEFDKLPSLEATSLKIIIGTEHQNHAT